MARQAGKSIKSCAGYFLVAESSAVGERLRVSQACEHAVEALASLPECSALLHNNTYSIRRRCLLKRCAQISTAPAIGSSGARATLVVDVKTVTGDERFTASHCGVLQRRNPLQPLIARFETWLVSRQCRGTRPLRGKSTRKNDLSGLCRDELTTDLPT